MLIFAAIHQGSLSDPPPGSVITSAASWISDVLFGPLAAVIAGIAIAWVGFAMLTGRIDIRRGLSVVLGCFLLFGARTIADGLRSSSTSDIAPQVASEPPPPTYPATPVPPAANNSNAFDPYAGASIIQSGQ
jgi:type IV secretion system protein VirB2